MKHYSVEMKVDNSISKLLKHIKPSSRVLEFGCADGKMTKYMSEELNCNVYIVEYDKKSYSKAIQYAKGGICSDILKFEWKTAFEEKFDYIIFADVLEHLNNPQKVIKECKSILKDTGYLLVSVPNIGHNDILIKLFQQKFEYTNTGLLDNTHIHFFAYHELTSFFKNSGYVIQNLDSIVIPTGCTEQFKGGGLEDNISNVVLNELKKRESGEIYQFVICAQKKELDVNKKELKNWIEKPYREVKIYIDTGSGFNEKDTMLFRIYLNNKSMYEFSGNILLPYKSKHIRFDLVEGQGCFVTKSDFLIENGNLEKKYSKSVKSEKGIFIFGDDPIMQK